LIYSRCGLVSLAIFQHILCALNECSSGWFGIFD